jgi:hypothetical protein
MYKKKTTNSTPKMIKANCGASVKAHGKMKLQSGGMIGKIKKNEVFGTEEKRQEDMDRYMSGTSRKSSGRLAYNKGGAIGSSRGDTPEEEDIRAARRYKNGKNDKNGKNGTENNNGRK